jgi:hypothetical protein
MVRRIKLAVMAMCAGGLVMAGATAVAATPASAYGKANWQVTFAGTATAPSTGTAFGFWGWCDLAGGVSSGNAGDCEFAQYVHTPAGSGFTCHENLDLTAWSGLTGTFVITGHATVTPAGLTGPCLSLFPGSSAFAGVDTGFPAAAGHYNIGVGALAPGAVGEFNITVTELP